jgi:hypothetical protein
MRVVREHVNRSPEGARTKFRHDNTESVTAHKGAEEAEIGRDDRGADGGRLQ